MVKPPPENFDVAPVCDDIIRNYLMWQAERVFGIFHQRFEKLFQLPAVKDANDNRLKYRKEYRNLLLQSKIEMLRIYEEIWKSRCDNTLPSIGKAATENKIFSSLKQFWWNGYLDPSKQMFGEDRQHLYDGIVKETWMLNQYIFLVFKNWDRDYNFFSERPTYNESKLLADVEKEIENTADPLEKEALMFGLTQ